MFPGMYASDVLLSLRRAFRILTNPSIPPGIQAISQLRDIFNVKEYQTHDGAAAQMVVVCDTAPRIWISRCASRDDAMGIASSEGVWYSRRLGFPLCHLP